MKETQYALKKLDGWYLDRFDKGYTSEVAGEAVGRLAGRLEREGLLEKINKKGAINKFSRRSQLEEAGIYFSDSYATAERFQEGFPIEGETIDDVPEGLRKKYFEPLFESTKKIKEFVNNTRKKSVEIFPEELQNSEIDELFIQTFGNYNGFIEVAQSMAGLLPVLIEEASHRGGIPEEEVDIWKRFGEIATDEFPYIFEKVLGDLK